MYFTEFVCCSALGRTCVPLAFGYRQSTCKLCCAIRCFCLYSTGPSTPSYSLSLSHSANWTQHFIGVLALHVRKLFDAEHLNVHALPFRFCSFLFFTFVLLNEVFIARVRLRRTPAVYSSFGMGNSLCNGNQ